MALVTHLDQEYTCSKAIKGEDYIHLLDNEGEIKTAFDGISDFKDFSITDGEWVTPTPEEDLYYMNATQRQKFSEFMDKYSKIYNDLESTGYFAKMQDYQLKMKEFTLDSQLKVSKFFAEYGDVLISVAEAGLNVLTGILSFATGIYDFLQGGDMKAKTTTGVDLLASTYIEYSFFLINKSPYQMGPKPATRV